MADLKPLSPRITDSFVHKSNRISDPHDKPKVLNLEVEQPDNTSNDVVDPKTLKVRRTFKDARQAHAAYRRLKQQNVERNRKNQLIQKKLNNEPPYSPKKLDSMGQNWRSNRPTGFLSTMVSRIQPPFRQVIEQAPFLTYTKYPLDGVDSENKTKIFREEITKTVRGWKGNEDLLAQLVHENTTFGYAALCWDDTRDWKPEFLRQDYTFFSIETPQETDSTPIWARKRRYQISELLPILERAEVSALAGWHVKNLVKSINNAIPAGRTLDADYDARRYEDWIREGSYGASYENDAKYVELGEIFVKEPHGKISRYLFDDKSGDEICTQLDRYNKMSECLALFAVEIGSGALMSSRGAGRDLYNTHIAIDKARNLVIDNVYLKGMLLLKKTPTARPDSAPLTVMHPIAYISDGYEVVQQPLPADVDDFLKLDQFVSGLAEIQVGTFLPGEPVGGQQGKRTASEVNRTAAIENQLREGILMRWSKQYCRSVERMQKGICHPEHVKVAADLKQMLTMVRVHEPEAQWARREVVEAFDRSGMEIPAFLVPFEVPEYLDEDAIACCLRMMDRNLPPADILVMAHSPAVELMPDTTPEDNAFLDGLIQRYMGNPSINQDELMKLDWSRKVGESIANQVILPKDQVEALQVEATRQQIIELQSIMAGQEVPVSPRDNDMIHLTTMAEKLLPLVQQMPQGAITPQLGGAISNALGHFGQHLQQAEQKGTPKKQLGQYKNDLKQAQAKVDNEMQALQAQQGQQVPPQGGPAPAAAMSAPPRRIYQAQVNNVNRLTESRNPGQAGAISDVANPPRPPTAV
jgi:hypothetical protein